MQENKKSNVKVTYVNERKNARPALIVKPAAPQEKHAKSNKRDKVASDMGFYSPRGGASHNAVQTATGIKANADRQLATFSSAELFDCLKKKKQKESHDVYLKKELNKFRNEIEMKHRKSEMSKTYRFPRTCATECESPGDDIEGHSCNNGFI